VRHWQPCYNIHYSVVEKSWTEQSELSPRAGQKGFYRKDEGTNLPPNVGIYESKYTPWQPKSLDINALKNKLNYIWTFSSYRAVNTFSLGYKSQLVNAV
jgi:hypothetical protein